MILRDMYQEQLDNINKTYDQIDQNIKFLKDYISYLTDPKVSSQEKVGSLQAFEEGAIADMYRLADKSLADMLKLAKEYSEKSDAVSAKIDKLDNLIKALQDIIDRRKFELAVVRQRLSDSDTFASFLMGLPEDIRSNIYKEDFETLQAYNRYKESSPIRRTALAARAHDMLSRNPELVLAIIERAGFVEADLKAATEELTLAKAELEELQNSLKEYKTIARESNNAAIDIVNVDVASRNLGRLKEVFSDVQVTLNKVIKTKSEKDTKTKSEANSERANVEPSNLTDEEFAEGT